ncbi:MAG: hypothetical protein ACU833_03850 [Gammaproteobacteria bacterium]
MKSLFSALFPLLIMPLLGWLIAEGRLNFGGGEKDVLLLFPWLVFSVVYLAAFIVCRIKQKSVSAGIGISALFSAGFLACLWLGLYLYLGFRG